LLQNVVLFLSASQLLADSSYLLFPSTIFAVVLSSPLGYQTTVCRTENDSDSNIRTSPAT
jgi:hypothetical protein